MCPTTRDRGPLLKKQALEALGNYLIGRLIEFLEFKTSFALSVLTFSLDFSDNSGPCELFSNIFLDSKNSAKVL